MVPKGQVECVPVTKVHPGRRATVSLESQFSSPSSDTTMAACLFYLVDVANPARPSTACARPHGEGAPLLPGLCAEQETLR